MTADAQVSISVNNIGSPAFSRKKRPDVDVGGTMAKSYFAILGISIAASEEEIRSAYRRLVKAYHPDHFKGGSEAFREIQEAYSVLGDARRRHQYKRSLERKGHLRPPKRRYQAPAEPLVPEAEPVHRENISPVRSFQTFSPSLEENFEWISRKGIGSEYFISASGRWGRPAGRPYRPNPSGSCSTVSPDRRIADDRPLKFISTGFWLSFRF